MRIHKLLSGAVILGVLSAFGANAQSVVSPVGWADVEAPSSNSIPFGSNATPTRYLQVHDDLTGGPLGIDGLAFRRGATTPTGDEGAFSVTLDAFMSTATTTGATISATFDNNHGVDKVQVVTNGTFNFPASTNGFVPFPFAYQIPFTTPFPHLGTGSLCWEVQVTARMNQQTMFHDSFTSSASTALDPPMGVTQYGVGCIATGETDPFELTGSHNNDWPANRVEATMTIRDGPANALAALQVGFSATVWAGVPLPFALPGTDVGPSGTCFARAEGIVTLPVMLGSNGSSSIQRITTTAAPILHGNHLYSQGVALDMPANSFGLITTNGLDHQIVAPYTVPSIGRVYESGSLDPTGTANPNWGLVTEFSHL